MTPTERYNRIVKDEAVFAYSGKSVKSFLVNLSKKEDAAIVRIENEWFLRYIDSDKQKGHYPLCFEHKKFLKVDCNVPIA